MKEDLIVFEEFPGEKIKDKNKVSFLKKYDKIIFIVLIMFLLTLLFFVSSIANKKLLDSINKPYYEKI